MPVMHPILKNIIDFPGTIRENDPPLVIQENVPVVDIAYLRWSWLCGRILCCLNAGSD
jgi:hypothetical protein